MIRPLSFALGAFCLLLIAAPCPAQSKLRYKFKEGEKRSAVLDQKMTMKMNIKGMDLETKVEQTVEMAYVIKKIDDKGRAHGEMSFGQIKITLHTPGGIFELDSSDEGEPKDAISKVLRPVLKTLSTTRLSFVQDTRGTISEVEIPEAILKKLQALEAGGAPGSFDEGSVRAMIESSIVFPEEKVAKGKTWSNDQKVQLPFGKIVSNLAFTHEGQEEKNGRTLEKLSFIPKIKIEPSDKGEIKISLKDSEGKGTVWFDNEAGRLVEQRAEITMQMEIEVMGMTISQTVIQNTVVRMKDEK